jgi:hypothetical protein
MNDETRKQLEDFARTPGLPRKVYSAIADCVSWTRRFYPHEMGLLGLKAEVEDLLSALDEAQSHDDLLNYLEKVRPRMEAALERANTPPPADWYGRQ